MFVGLEYLYAERETTAHVSGDDHRVQLTAGVKF
jgi:hypothetical protein